MMSMYIVFFALRRNTLKPHKQTKSKQGSLYPTYTTLCIVHTAYTVFVHYKYKCTHAMMHCMVEKSECRAEYKEVYRQD